MNRQGPEEAQNNASGTFLTILMCLLGSVVLIPPPSLSPLYYLVLRDNLSEMLVAAMGMALIFSWARGHLKIKFCAGHLLLLLFVAGGALSILYCTDRVSGLQRVHLFVSWFVLTVAGFYAFKNRKNLIIYARWMAIVAIVICVLGLLEARHVVKIITPDVDVCNQIASALGYPTVYAGYLLAAIFLFQCGYAMADRRLDRALFGLALILLVLNLYFCRSLASWVVFIICEAMYVSPRLLNVFKSLRNRCILYAVVLVAAAALGLVLTRTDWADEDISHLTRKNESVGARLAGWDMAWDMIGERPILGFGAGQYEVYLPHYRARAGRGNYSWEHDAGMYYPINTDNFVFNRLFEQGFVGLALFLGVFLWTFHAAFVRSKSLSERDRRAVKCQGYGIAAILGYALFHFPFLSPCVWGMIWANVSIIWALSQKTGVSEISTPPHAHGNLSKWAAAGGFTARCVLLLLFAFLLYLPLGRWVNDTKIKKGTEYATTENTNRFRGEFESALPLVPKSWRYYYFYGNALAMNKHNEEAVLQLKKGERLRPHSILILRSIRAALFLDKQADREELDSYTEKLREIDIEAAIR